MTDLPSHDAQALEVLGVKLVHSFEELLTTRFAGGINALCWKRELPGDFAQVAAAFSERRGMVSLDEGDLCGLALGEAGRAAVEVMLRDRDLLAEAGLDPVLNYLEAYPRDESEGPIPTDVVSFHVDSAPCEADTWLCTYFGPSSEGLPNAQAIRKIDIPAIRAELLAMFGGGEGEAFEEFLAENCYDLHYAPLERATPYTFGVGNLWRVAVQYPESPVLPCIHRAPDNTQSRTPRLLLIS